ncbi:hypothetical protein MAPG_02069 [Magnaporthiopsis poae ATCC 64411]|uniref:BAG domain-containing protein n=1 Tax=Magnaporthiopsis poae (strain ATCC 64411 / 73-15) TaxID=644358 RepID=A0A0C4DQD0_MAGP6|nr:hypothetical protein MAPG_02069 [Magnaporthiopsis poae ATCC 64411]
MASSSGSILACSSHVRQLFRDTIAQLEPKGGPNGPSQSMTLARDVTDALDRFGLWAGNLGALLPLTSRLSLDRRLADAPETSERICEVLDDLGEAVSDLLELFSNTPERSTDVDSDGDLDLADAEPADHTLGQDFEPDGPAETVDDSTEKLDDARSLLDCISEYLRSLFRIAVMVRNAGPRDRFRHALQASNTTFTDIVDINHLREKHPKLSEDLRTLLGRANAKRRQFLKYSRDHSLRLAAERDESKQIEVTESHPARTELLSSKATTFAQPSLDAVEDDILSLISASTVSGENQVLSLPRLAALSPDGAPFECPLCRTFQTFEQEGAWQKHAFRDLKAYTCTAGCDSMFGDRRAWFEHELRTHRTRYTCRLCSLPGSLSEDQLKAHISSTHGGFLESHTQKLLDSGREPITRFTAQDCPFCDEWALKLQARQDPKGKHAENRDGDIVVSVSRFRRHVAAHHEQLAIFAVPREMDDDSNPGTISTPSTLSTPTIPTAPREYTYPPAAPGSAMETLNKIAMNFNDTLRPLAQEFVTNPPADEKKRKEEYLKHTQTILRDVMLKLDEVDTGGNETARARRKELVKDVQRVLAEVDKVVTPDSGSISAASDAQSEAFADARRKGRSKSQPHPGDEVLISLLSDGRHPDVVASAGRPAVAEPTSPSVTSTSDLGTPAANKIGPLESGSSKSPLSAGEKQGYTDENYLLKNSPLLRPTPLAGSRKKKGESSPTDYYDETEHPSGMRSRFTNRVLSRTVDFLGSPSKESVKVEDKKTTTATEASQGVSSGKSAPAPKATRGLPSGAATTRKKGKIKFTTVWYCCQCHDGPLYTTVDSYCPHPSCRGHYRCGYCRVLTLDTYE